MHTPHLSRGSKVLRAHQQINVSNREKSDSMRV